MSRRDGRGWADHVRMLWCFFEAAYPDAPRWAAVDFIAADLRLDGLRGSDVWVVPANPGGGHKFDAFEWEFQRRICKSCGVNWWETVRPWWAASDPQVCCPVGIETPHRD